MRYDFREICTGGTVSAAKQDSSGMATIRIEPSIGLAWDGRLRPREAAAVAAALEGPISVGASNPVRIGLESLAVRRTVHGAEIEVTGVMVHSEIDVRLDMSQATRLAAVLRPPAPPPPSWNAGADKRRDDGMRRIFGLTSPHRRDILELA